MVVALQNVDWKTVLKVNWSCMPGEWLAEAEVIVGLEQRGLVVQYQPNPCKQGHLLMGREGLCADVVLRYVQA